MKTNLRRSNEKFFVSTFGLLLLLLAVSAQSAVAQTNTFPASGNVGIGTTGPSLQLHVLNTSTAQARIESTAAAAAAIDFKNTSRRWVIGSGLLAGGGDFSIYDGNVGITRMFFDTAGNVGIGTISPNGKLEVSGSSGTPNYATGLTGNLRVGNGAAEHIEFGYVTGARTWIQGFGAVPLYINEGGNNVILNSGGGNVGIGTTTPTRRLEVLAADGEALRLYRNSSNAGWGVNLKFAFNNSSGAEVDYAGLHGVTETTTSGSEAGHLIFTTVNSGSLTEKMRITSGGSLGVGTTTPGYRLDVQGGLINSSGGVCIAGDCKTAWSQVGGGGGGSSQWTTSGSSIYYSSGNVGIGTTGPSQKFQVIGSAGFFNSAAGISINGGLSSGIADIYSDYLSGSEPKLHLATFSKKATASGITIDTAGNVGIGITNPTAALDIQGDIKVTGNINAKYQDVAEWVESSQSLPAGTVVVLDATKSNQVIASAQAYDTRVAGVISAQPGITLGEKGDSKVLVATTGRVKVRVDASSGPIQVGDLLVTSDIAGVAKKSEPLMLGGVPIHRPGTLIGKALEPLANGTGEILVLLSLQ